MSITQFTSSDIAIDLGTSSTRVFVKGRGIVVNEPSVVAYKAQSNGKIVAVGDVAEEIAGRSGNQLRLERPIRGGKVIDLETAQLMVQYFVNKALGSVRLKPRVLGTEPIGSTRMESAMLVRTLESVGVRKHAQVDQIIASGLGAGLSIYEPQGNFVVDIGAGKTEIALLSMGGVVLSSSKPIAGNQIDVAIGEYVVRQYGIQIVGRVAEQIKFDLIDVRQSASPDRTIIVRGRDVVTGMPTVADVSLAGICEAIHDVLSQIAEAIQSVLSRTPPELCQDVLRNGITLCGGTSRLPKIDEVFAEAFGIPVHVSSSGGDCAVLGAGYMTDHYDMFSGSAFPVKE